MTKNLEPHSLPGSSPGHSRSRSSRRPRRPCPYVNRAWLPGGLAKQQATLQADTQPYMEPGEEIRVVILTLTRSPWVLGEIFAPKRLIVVTDRNVVICKHHVVLPAAHLPRRVDHTDTVGAALLAAAQGAGHRRVAADLDRPVDTVRGWLRRFRGQSELLRAIATRLAVSLDPRFEPERPQPTPLG